MHTSVDRTTRNPGHTFTRAVAQYRRMPLCEERELVLKAQGGCVDSRNRMIENNLGFVIQTLIKKYGYKDFHELIGSATLGMTEAVMRFNPDKGIRFISYAVWWIRQGAMKQIEEDSTVRQPSNQVAERVRLHNRMANYNETPHEAAKQLGISDYTLKSLNVSYLSLDAPVSDDNDSTLGGVMPDESAEDTGQLVSREQIHNKLMDCVNMLSGYENRERDVVILHYGLGDLPPKNYTEIGQIWGLTRERVRQYHGYAMKKLERFCRLRGLDASALSVMR